ncbi:MAG: pseudouridine synthase [Clostridiaceae bacterium]|jgi:23S rRNA pseudouridine2604 synthase|nr:pseudouridine synthase [Clostridiaceae bacterium]
MRINNYISSAGLCSRRKADELIRAGKVTINGVVAVLGATVNPADLVAVDGQILKPVKTDIYIALNKPRGIISTTERQVKGNIIDFVNHPERIFPVGRLDKDSEGLILLTNDGSCVNKILRNENKHEKEYIVTVNKPIRPAFLKGMSAGVRIYNPVRKEYTLTNPSRVVQIDDRTFRIFLTQGLNRQIRRMCSHFGYQVVKLLRVRILNIELKDLPSGQWRDLTEEELRTLFELTGL